MNALLYKRRMEMLRLVYMGEDPHNVMFSLATEGGVLNKSLLYNLRNDWSRRANWIPEIVRASSKDMAVFQAELLGVAREVRKRAFDMVIDKQNVRPKERVMALNTVMGSLKMEMEILRYVSPTPEVEAVAESLEGKREALSLILRGLEESDPDLAFNVSKVLANNDLASLPKLADMR